MILLSEEQIEDARSGIQEELSELMGYLILVRIVNDPERSRSVSPTVLALQAGVR
jgi:hypothetical protein